jgi:hypothetical protein
MQALQAHFVDGDAEAEKQKEAAAYSDLKVSFYHNEAASFPFNKHLNHLKKCADVLEEVQCPIL